MRARLMMKLVGIIVTLVLTVLAARSCSGTGGANSDLNPTNFANNAIAGLCADQAADVAAGGAGEPAGTLVDPANPEVQSVEKATGAGFSCPTTTVDLYGNGS